jgi:hypothetical protein
MINDDFDSILFAFSKGEDEDELMDFSPQDMLGGDQTNSVMSPVSDAGDSK